MQIISPMFRLLLLHKITHHYISSVLSLIAYTKQKDLQHVDYQRITRNCVISVNGYYTEVAAAAHEWGAAYIHKIGVSEYDFRKWKPQNYVGTERENPSVIPLIGHLYNIEITLLSGIYPGRIFENFLSL